MQKESEQFSSTKETSFFLLQIAMAAVASNEIVLAPVSKQKKKRILPPLVSGTQTGSYSQNQQLQRKRSDVQPDMNRLSKLSPNILAQLKAVEVENTLTPGHIFKDIKDTGIAEGKKISQLTLKSGKQLDICLEEGTFRRIAGMKEETDASGSFKIRVVELEREPGRSLGFYIRQGDGWNREDGIFISRINLGSLVETNGLLSMGDEILKVNNVNVTRMPFDDVVVIMQYVKKLVLTVKILTSVSLTRTWSMRHQTSFIQRQRQSHTDSKLTDFVEDAKQSRNIHNKDEASSQLANTFESEYERPDHPYERIDFIQEKPPETIPKDLSNTPEYQPPLPPLTSSSISEESLKVARDTQKPHESTAEIEESSTFSEFSTGTLVTPMASHEIRYSGMLSVTLHGLHNTVTLADKTTNIACTISVEAVPKAEARVGFEDKSETFLIDLENNTHFTILLTSGELTASKSVHLVQLFSSPNDRESRNILLNIEPIGRLKISLEYQPMKVAVSRMSPQGTSSSATSFKEFIDSNPSQSGLPLVVQRSVQIIEQYGLETNGLYSMCASEDAKTEAFDATLSQMKNQAEIKEIVSRVSVHAFTGVLKDFFRTLPEPFFTNDTSLTLTEAATMENAQSVVEKFVECLPEEVLTTLHFLLTHFKDVFKHSSANGVTVGSLAKMFGPLLLTPTLDPTAKADPLAEDFEAQANVLKIILSMQIV